METGDWAKHDLPLVSFESQFFCIFHLSKPWAFCYFKETVALIGELQLPAILLCCVMACKEMDKEEPRGGSDSEA